MEKKVTGKVTKKKASKTKSVGQKTQSFTGRHDRLKISNKHEDYDYAFVRKEDIQEGSSPHGFEVISETNNDGECLGGLPKSIAKSQMRKGGVIAYQDTVLCRREKEVTAYFKQQENEKYNAQMKMIKNASRNARTKLRHAEGDVTITDQSNMNTKQRVGISN